MSETPSSAETRPSLGGSSGLPGHGGHQWAARRHGYLRTGLVVRNRWIDDVTFVELLSIRQTCRA